MASRNDERHFENRFYDEPRVIAVSATRQQLPLFWSLAAVTAAYAWLTMLLLG